MSLGVGHHGEVKRAVSVDEAEGMLRSRADLALLGWGDRRIASAVREGEVERVHRGWYVLASEWKTLWPEGQHLVRVVAACREMVGGTHVLSFSSAAVVHGLPIFRTRLARLHLTGSTAMQSSNSASIIRHEERLSPEDIEVVGGMRCTTVERTAFDLMRTLSPEAAVSVADAALGAVAARRHVTDPQLAEEWRERMRRRAREAGAVRGIRQARWTIEFADGGAQLPGESVTRLQLSRLGFGRVRTQVPVRAADGSTYWVDLGMDEVNAFTEFDGEGKYLDEAMRSGRTIEQVLLDEKRREDWIRGTSQRRFARVGDAHIGTPFALGRRLAAFSIVPPR